MRELTGGGLYLLGMVSYNLAKKEPEYWIKVGISDKFKKRLQSYFTHNPAVLQLDFLNLEERHTMVVFENIAHALLNDICIGKTKRGREWFKVSEKDFNRIVEQGFFWFRNIHGEWAFECQ